MFFITVQKYITKLLRLLQNYLCLLYNFWIFSEKTTLIIKIVIL